MEDYAKKLLPSLEKRIANSTNLSSAVKGWLLPLNADGTKNASRLKALLIYEPKTLFRLSEVLMKRIIPGYNLTELKDVSIALKTINPTQVQKNLMAKYELIKHLVATFDYNGTIGTNKSRSYKITAAANHNTCVYCNRQYALNIERNGGKNNDDRIARPVLDHWFPKSLFPLMSLSYYNLIPSCTVCNSSAKIDDIWTISTHIHPYLTTPDVPKFKFRYKPGINSTWNIDFKDLAGKEANTIKALCLQEVYQEHCELEVADLIEMASKNNGSYMKQLYGTILRLYTAGANKSKAYRLLGLVP